MPARFLITGASGLLGACLLRELSTGADAVSAWSGTRSETLFGTPVEPVNLANADEVAAAFRRARPTTIIHAAAVSTVAACYRDPSYAHEVNARGSARLAELAAGAGARLVLVSTDLVFDGTGSWYTERDAPAPGSVYARSKVAAEQAVLAVPRAAVARVSLLFGPTLVGREVFFDTLVRALREQKPIRCFTDEWRTPLGFATAARALIGLARSEVAGVLHVGGPERLSRWEMGQQLAAALQLDPGVLIAATRDELVAPEPRPQDVSLDSSRWRGLFPAEPWPTFAQALREMMPACGTP
jgi:dTDP-4-dehydrorhamnose reductase